MKTKLTRILTASGSFPSARLIRDAIQEITGKKYYIIDESKDTDILFRYGNSVSVSGNDPGYNSVDFINLCRDKYKFSKFCIKNGIYTPVYFTTEIPEKFPVIIRTTMTGFGGAGIIICNSMEEFKAKMRQGCYWTYFITTSFELRVHLFDETVSRLVKKVKNDAEEDKYPIRNSHNGYHFSLRSEENLSKNYERALEVVGRLAKLFVPLGGHFSGIDLGYDPERKEYIVFEANSAPGLSENNARDYANFIVSNVIQKGLGNG